MKRRCCTADLLRPEQRCHRIEGDRDFLKVIVALNDPLASQRKAGSNRNHFLEPISLFNRLRNILMTIQCEDFATKEECKRREAELTAAG